MKHTKITFLLIVTAAILTACSDNSGQISPQENKNDPYPDSNYEKIEQTLEKSSYLRGKLASFQEQEKEICTKLISDENLTLQIQNFVDNSKKSDSLDIGGFSSVCKKGKNTYVIFETKGPSKFISVWKDEKSFDFFRDEQGEIASYGSQGSISFFPESLEGKSLVYLSSTDIPVYGWQFHILDTGTMKSSLAEECGLEFEFDEQKSFINADRSELKCGRKYATKK